jgi:hypothetical protein
MPSFSGRRPAGGRPLFVAQSIGTNIGRSPESAARRRVMLKFLGTTVGVIFLIGLLVVIGLIALIF